MLGHTETKVQSAILYIYFYYLVTSTPTPTTNIESQPNKCNPNPCQNSAVCVPIATVGFLCQCPKQFTGKLCSENAKSYCHPSPCLNGGLCTEVVDGYKCTCVGHFRGINCQGIGHLQMQFAFAQKTSIKYDLGF